jgi:hypothetical protein
MFVMNPLEKLPWFFLHPLLNCCHLTPMTQSPKR